MLKGSGLLVGRRAKGVRSLSWHLASANIHGWSHRARPSYRKVGPSGLLRLSPRVNLNLEETASRAAGPTEMTSGLATALCVQV